MPLSWNEIRARAARFADDWKEARYEKGETQTFYNEFFEVFGNRRRNVAVYEEKVKKLNNKHGFIDLFWPGHLLVEQKSAGRDLSKAREQATDYFVSLSEKEKPRYILLSDFQTFELLDLDENEEHRFTLSELPDQVRHFAFIAGYQQQKYRDQDPANIEASELMSNLHKHLEKSGYTGHDLERLLVRIMFCLFAEDTGIFPLESFLRLIEDRTGADGSDLGNWLIHLFQVLNTAVENRQKNLDEDLAAFPYVNGNLFAEPINIPSFDTDMRSALLKCAYFDWTKVSPALFGSLFQTVMLPEAQRQGGAHYTSEKNILKVIQPLFLDELHTEFKNIKAIGRGQRQKLEQLQDKLSRLTFLDPACGCGNFLILAFRELRQLEMEILEKMHPRNKYGEREAHLNISDLTKVSVDQFYGIEIEEFPVRIAEAAMWLVDHQMNMKLSEAFGQAFTRLPLADSAHIYHGNALTTDWADVLPVEKCSFILGNPPFIGHHYQSEDQKAEQKKVMAKIKAHGVLDYVCNWYMKAVEYIKESNIKVAFVSTNSIAQGEQVGLLWFPLLFKYGIHIHFAHRTFKWTIDDKKAKGMRIASVHAVIIGFADYEAENKYLYEYESQTSDPHKIKATNINPYLVDAPNAVIQTRSDPICEVPKMKWGNKPTDGGHFILLPKEKEELLAGEPEARKHIHRYMSGGDFINGIERYCLWLKDADPSELRKLPLISNRVQAVREFRLKSKAESTRKYADMPTLFRQISQPDTNYLAIPEVSSEQRLYIPIAFLSSETICSNTVQFVPDATPYHFGVLTSRMHMGWVRYVCGRLKSDYRYSNSLVYNNFPWPDISESVRENIASKAEAVLKAREQFPDSTLADLYDPKMYN